MLLITEIEISITRGEGSAAMKAKFSHAEIPRGEISTRRDFPLTKLPVAPVRIPLESLKELKIQLFMAYLMIHK